MNGHRHIGTPKPHDPAPRRLVILGSTGSIGTQALEVVAAHPGRFQVVGLAARHNADLLTAQARRFRPRVVALAAERDADILRDRLADMDITVSAGADGLEDLAQYPDADTVLLSVVGVTGLRPALAAARAGKTIALANKESLVVGGALLTRAVRDHGARLIPVDSEHSGLFQCLQGGAANNVTRLVLTASGGPFLGWRRDQLEAVTRAQALAHPTWQMGKKITVDSATLFNKGLEVIEAHWLFAMPYDRLDVLIHPQSVVHGMVEFTDGSCLAQLSVPDMRVPIQYALTYPDRWTAPWPRLDLTAMEHLTFRAIEPDEFPCFDLAREAGQRSGTAPAVLNAADEVAVEAFLQERIGFLDIPRVLERTLSAHQTVADPTLDDVLAADREGRAALDAAGVA